MHIAIRVPLTFLGLQAAWSGIAWACSCLEDAFREDPAAAAESLDIVFVGEVVVAEEEVSGGCGGSSGDSSGGGVVGSADPVLVSFEVTEALKGTEVGEVFELTTAREGASCGLDAVEGDLWLVGLDAGQAEYYLCDPGGPLDQGFDEALDAVREALAD